MTTNRTDTAPPALESNSPQAEAPPAHESRRTAASAPLLVAASNTDSQQVLMFLLYALTRQGNFSNTRPNRETKEILQHESADYIIKSLTKRIGINALGEARQEVTEALTLGIDVIPITSERYPPLLKEICDPPLVLFVRGVLPSAFPIAIVGTRRSTTYGRRIARTFSHDLTLAGGSIVSGLAHGIDAAAHEGAIRASLQRDCCHPGTAVFGSGVCSVYPAANRRLADDLLAAGGAIVSEFGLFQRPRKDLFPRRNRIVSGLSRAVIVVQAAERSGSLITARTALEQGRDVFAVPGPVDCEVSRGVHVILGEGATLATGAQSITELYPELQRAAEPELSNIDVCSLPQLARTIVTLLRDEQEMTFDDLCSALEITAEVLGPVVGELELSGLLVRSSEGYALE
ncbi:MAG: DNA-processing protein DprA [Bdellovibrionales bacterium]|nr:DNA-processing protein DprA [Bdellovibrionales bacterium]